MRVVAVIPALNEENTIGGVVESVSTFVDACIVVDDGSSDRTADFARERRAVVLSHLLNRGQGAALETGNHCALSLGAEIIVHFDADGQHSVEDIPRLVEPIARGEADVVFGSRFLENQEPRINNQCSDLLATSHLLLPTHLPFSKRYLLLPLARLVNRLVAGVWLSDAHCGLRALSRHAAEAIEITQDRMAHNTEIPAQLRGAGLKYVEVPVSIRYREYGQGIGGGFAILRDLTLGRFL